MSDNPITYARTLDELVGKVRRFLGDISPRDPIFDPTRVREVATTVYIELIHDLGWDDRTERDWNNVEEYVFTLAPGEYRTSEVKNHDIVALGNAYNNRGGSMEKKPRWWIEQQIDFDLKNVGHVQPGFPRYWAVQRYWDNVQSLMAYKFVVYPATTESILFTVPHTIMDMRVLDPTATVPKSMLSYIANEAWMRRTAAELMEGLDEAGMKILRLSPRSMQSCRERAEADVQRAREQQQMDAMQSSVQEYQA